MQTDEYPLVSPALMINSVAVAAQPRILILISLLHDNTGNAQMLLMGLGEISMNLNESNLISKK